MLTANKYPAESLKRWKKAKELREQYYINYARAKEKGGLRCAAAGWSFDAIPTAFGDDVYLLTGEPYGASIAHDPKFAKQCMDAAESAGFARDLCSYMRIYWGAMHLNKYLFGGEYPKPDGTWGPRTTPMDKGIDITTRDQALRLYADWNLSKPLWQHFFDPSIKTEMMKTIVRDWKVDGVMMHLNRGCEGLSIGIMENRLGLAAAGIPVMSYEGNMGDEREFDEVRAQARVDAFMEQLGLR